MIDTSQSEFEYSYEKRYRDRVFTIGVRTDPSINSIESWAVVLQFSLEDGTYVRIIQADNTEHEEGEIHLDCYYREIGRDVKNFDVEFDGPFEAESHIKENFERYVDYYVDTHGWGPRDDEKNC